jgi:hypothetical protein
LLLRAAAISLCLLSGFCALESDPYRYKLSSISTGYRLGS